MSIWQTLHRAWEYTRKYRVFQLLGFICATSNIIFKLLYWWLNKVYIDEVLMTKTMGKLLPVTLGFIAAVFISNGLDLLSSYFFNKMSADLVLETRGKLFSHLMNLRMDFYKKQSTGEILMRVINDTNSIGDFLSNSIVRILGSALTILLIFCWLFYLNWRMAMLSVPFIPWMLFLAYTFRKVLERKNAIARHASGEFSSFIEEQISGYRAIKAMNLYDRSEKILIQKEKKYNALEIVRMLVDRTAQSIGWTFFLAPYNFVMYLFAATWFFNTGSPTIGTMVAFAMYVNMLVQPTMSLLDTVREFANVSESLKRVDELMGEEQEHLGDLKESSVFSCPITFKNVKFSYDGKEVLKGIDITIKPNSITALVGSSGAGKTTILNLLFGILEPTEGQIYIGDTPLKMLDLAFLRNHVSYVTQDGFLFHTTLRDNLLLANPMASEQQLMDALRKAQLSELVAELPDGLDTVVGKQGEQLSGGERQRVCIAQALLRDAPILLLDEPTSALDMGTERAFMEFLRQYRQQKTIILVTHRPSAMEWCDQVVVLNQGRVVAQGDFDQIKKDYESVLAV